MAGKPLFQLNAGVTPPLVLLTVVLSIIPLRIHHYRRSGIGVIHEAVRGTNYCAGPQSI